MYDFVLYFPYFEIFGIKYCVYFEILCFSFAKSSQNSVIFFTRGMELASSVYVFMQQNSLKYFHLEFTNGGRFTLEQAPHDQSSV